LSDPNFKENPFAKDQEYVKFQFWIIIKINLYKKNHRRY